MCINIEIVGPRVVLLQFEVMVDARISLGFRTGFRAKRSTSQIREVVCEFSSSDDDDLDIKDHSTTNRPPTQWYVSYPSSDLACKYTLYTLCTLPRFLRRSCSAPIFRIPNAQLKEWSTFFGLPSDNLPTACAPYLILSDCCRRCCRNG